MKIVSDDSRILDELFDHLDMENIEDFELEKIEVEDDNTSDERAMGGSINDFLSMSANAIAVFTAIKTTISYINRNYPEWDIVFKPFVSNKYEVTMEKYESMSENAKKAIHENYDVVITKK